MKQSWFNTDVWPSSANETISEMIGYVCILNASHFVQYPAKSDNTTSRPEERRFTFFQENFGSEWQERRKEAEFFSSERMNLIFDVIFYGYGWYRGMICKEKKKRIDPRPTTT